MKLSYHWLSQYLDLSNTTPETVGDKLTLHTCELEEVLPQKQYFENVYTGKMLSREPHPDSDKLSVAQFDLGKLGTKQIIFGQMHEVSVGEILPIALAGATLKSGIEINDGDIRGVRSEGMITTNQELGMKNEELIRFGSDTPLGKPLPEVCEEFSDVLLDIDNKSLTHRPDLMGHRGFVRELGVMFGQEGGLTSKNLSVDMNEAVKVSITTDDCKRFMGVLVEGIQVQPSSLAVQARLENLGVRAISNLVDITNWILLEYGQPMHVFDADKVEGDIIVRKANNGETLEALDGETYELADTDIVIADSKKVLSIAGIMGGLDSGVTESTTNVIFECANFDPVSIRKTSTRLGLRSESSMRFEKTLDPEACAGAMKAALDLLESGEIKGGMDVYPQQPDPITIQTTCDFIRRRSGMDIEDVFMVDCLKGLGFDVDYNDGDMSVVVPSWRATKDVSIAEDLLEEIVRMYGFDKIPSTLPTLPIFKPQQNMLRSLEWSLRDYWSQAGYFEAKHYSFIPESDPFFDEDKVVRIANPLSEQTAVMRQTLLSRMLMDIENEVRSHGELSVFEIGKTYVQESDTLPEQVLHLGLIRSKINQDENELFLLMKSDIEQLADQQQVAIVWKPLAEQTGYSHPGKSAQIEDVDGNLLGVVTVVHPSYVPMQNAPIVFAEINLELWLQTKSESEWQYEAPSFYPATSRDVSFIVENKVLVGDIERSLIALSPLVQEVRLFDSFEDDEKIGVGKKNLAFHLVFQSNEKTLEDADVETLWAHVVDCLKAEYSASIRDV